MFLKWPLLSWWVKVKLRLLWHHDSLAHIFNTFFLWKTLHIQGTKQICKHIILFLGEFISNFRFHILMDSYSPISYEFFFEFFFEINHLLFCKRYIVIFSASHYLYTSTFQLKKSFYFLIHIYLFPKSSSW